MTHFLSRSGLLFLSAILLTLTACQGGRNSVAVPPTGTPISSSPSAGMQPAVRPVSFPTPSLGQPPYVEAQAYIVVDPRSGQILLEKNAHQRRQVASTQKLITALVILDDGNLDEMITVAPSDTWVEPVKMGIKAGERYRKKDLLESMMVRSSNDIAQCLARDHAGSEERFTQFMNAKARSLGMRNSNFRNATGFTAAGQHSTAFDLAILATNVLNNDYLSEVCSRRAVYFRFNDGRTKAVTSTNKVLGMTPYCKGMKTGYTNAAGRCLISVGERGSRKVVVVVLGSKTPHIWEDSRDLIHWGLGIRTNTT